MHIKHKGKLTLSVEKNIYWEFLGITCQTVQTLNTLVPKKCQQFDLFSGGIRNFTTKLCQNTFVHGVGNSC